MGTDLSELHTGYRAFSRKVLLEVPFLRNSLDFAFDTELLMQASHFGFRFHEVPVRDDLQQRGVVGLVPARRRLRRQVAGGRRAPGPAPPGDLAVQEVPGVKRVCVFSGSSPGADIAYRAGATDLGHALADRGIEVVYGGAHVGLMGTVADAALEGGGHVIGVIPQSLVDREIAHPGISDLRIVDSMHERKAQMAELSDAFVALPGGLGTLEELFEIYTWNQLGLHAKPLGLFNVRGYYDGLARFLDHAVEERFVTRENRAMLLVSEDLGELLDGLAAWQPPHSAEVDRSRAELTSLAMAGHSKWAGIKHKKAIVDSRRGKLFTKLARAITVAAKEGGGDIEGNPRLSLAVQKAKDASMPKDNIERAIAKGTGEGADVDALEDVVYEGYGPGGVALLVEAVTDNRNRTGSEVRHIFAKGGGNLGEPGSVAYLFDKKGIVVVDANRYSEDDLMVAIDAGAEDIALDDDVYEIVCEPADLTAVRESLESAGIELETAEIAQQPKTRVPLDEDGAGKLLRLIDALEDQDDVDTVHANFDVDAEVLERVAG